MARTATSSTMSPFVLATGQGIYYEQVRAVVEMLNYAFQETQDVHVSLISGGDDFNHDGGIEIKTHNTIFPAAAGWNTFYRFRFWIDPDVQSVRVGAVCYNPTPDTLQVRFTVGGAGAVTFTYATTSLNEQTSNIATSSTGTGWQTVTIELNHSVGATVNCAMDRWRLENVVAGSLPAPVVE